ncbi:hypothetical protein LTR66_010249 [Elasticomyces elasticus]|nr:hypothetical protein LTR66_010249 [Elasticomyces elasticus]
MESQLPHYYMESAVTLPASMDAAHVNGWTLINDKCYITPAIDRLNSLQAKGFFERREQALDARSNPTEYFLAAMTPTPLATSLSPVQAQAQSAVSSPPNPIAYQPPDPVVKRVQELMGTVGLHETLLGEQVADTLSILEEAIIHVRQLHAQALVDITRAARGLRELRDDLIRAKAPSTSPHQNGAAPDDADDKNSPSATNVEHTFKSQEGGRATNGPVSRAIQEHNQGLDGSVSTVSRNNKRAGEECSGGAIYNNSYGPRKCQPCGFVAQGRHQPKTSPSMRRDGTPHSPIDDVSGTRSDGRHPPSTEQEQPHVDDPNEKQQRAVQQHSEHAERMDDGHTATPGFMPTDTKASKPTSSMITARPVESSISPDTAISSTSSAMKPANNDTRLFTPSSSPSGGTQPLLPDSIKTKSVRSSENTPQSIPRSGTPLLEVQTSTSDEETAAQPAPRVEESVAMATKGVKRRLEDAPDAGRKRSCQRVT